MNIDTAGTWHFDSISKTYLDMSAWLGYMEMTDTIAGLRFDTISEADFGKFDKRYKSRIDTSDRRITRTEESFTIKTGGGEKWFSADSKHHSSFYVNYFGYFEQLDLYVIQTIDLHNEIGDLRVVDGKTGKQYYILSPFDYPFETLLLSPGTKYLLTFANNYYERNESALSLLKINKKEQHYTLRTYNVSAMGHYQIEKAVWINDSSFALKVKENILVGNTAGEAQNVHFLKASFDE